MNPKITIIIPTTTDRGLLLPLVVGSIQNQTVQEFEIFIIGDGINEDSRSIIHKLASEDSRIKFFDHPKHPRRGENYRHEALKTCKSEYVTYMCDRDLLLPNHFENLLNSFKKGNFVSVIPFIVKDAAIFYDSLAITNYKKMGGVLSAIGHTLELYNALPYGWRNTPKGLYTDVYMWEQFLAHKDCLPYFSVEASFLYFKRGNHPGLSTPERYKELKFWKDVMENSYVMECYKEEAQRRFILEYVKIRTSWFRIKGKSIVELPNAIRLRISIFYRNLLK